MKRTISPLGTMMMVMLTHRQLILMQANTKNEWKRVMYTKPNFIHNDVVYPFNSLQFQVSEHIEPNQMDHLSSRDNDDASSSAADYEEEEEKAVSILGVTLRSAQLLLS